MEQYFDQKRISISGDIFSKSSLQGQGHYKKMQCYDGLCPKDDFEWL